MVDAIEQYDWSSLCLSAAKEGYHGIYIVCPPAPVYAPLLAHIGVIWVEYNDTQTIANAGSAGGFRDRCYQKQYDLYKLCGIDPPLW